MDVLKFFTVRLCPWDMHLTGRRRRQQGSTSVYKLALLHIPLPFLRFVLESQFEFQRINISDMDALQDG